MYSPGFFEVIRCFAYILDPAMVGQSQECKVRESSETRTRHLIADQLMSGFFVVKILPLHISNA
jgi:hypothetical protein